MSLRSDGLSSDQYFLVNFIMSNYLGPDVYSDNPRCSAFQRLAKGLPPYTLNHIGSSSLTIAQLQCLYYHVLRNAKSSLVLHPNMIYMYLKGYLPLEPVGMFPQFTSFFPTKLHPQKMYSPSHEIVKGIVVIDDPALAFISKEELHRFRCLSRLNDLKIDRSMCLSPRCVKSPGTEQVDLKIDRSMGLSPRCVKSPGIEQDCSRNGDANSNGLDTHQNHNSSGDLGETCKKKKEGEAVAGPAPCVNSKAAERDLGDIQMEDCYKDGEANSNGVVSDQDCTSSAELQETCKSKKEGEAVAVPALCINSKAADRDSGDILAENGCCKDGEANSSGVVSDQDCNSSAELQETCKRKKEDEEAVTEQADFGINKTPERFRETYQRKRFKNSSTKATKKNGETDQPNNLALVPVPADTKECDSEPPVVTTGTASKGTLGGVVDIGVNKVAYFFQVALPGVRKDSGEFSCEIDTDGKVILEGSTTTSGETVKRHSRVFKMKSQKLCAPGPFKLCFNLPGPVDPRLFSPNFRSDGIFEAVIIRHENSNLAEVPSSWEL